MRAFLHPNQAANLVNYPAIKGLNILHKLHSNFYIHCCFHFQRRFLYEFGLIATILLGSVCCQLWVAEPPFANNAEDISRHITLCTASSTSTTFVAFGFYNHPINWHSCTWLHLAVYNFFCIISGIFVYHSFTRLCGVATDDTVPHATAFILVSVLLMKIPSVGNEGTDGNMVWSGRICCCLIPCTICSNVS